MANPAMAAPQQDEFVDLLRRARAGDLAARDQLIGLLYQDLRQLAEQRMSRERPDHTLQPTALVHEALAKILADDTLLKVEDREFFYRAASRAMGQVLIDYHRHRASRKGPGRRRRSSLDDLLDVPASAEGVDRVDMQDALIKLEAIDLRASLVVQYRFFLGMTEPEVAERLGISQKTVERDWKFAREWLRSVLRDEDSP
jgi:RNA polymerase sigma factor (TIGR02999 family)